MNGDNDVFVSKHRSDLLKVLLRMTIYYLAIIAVLLFINWINQDLLKQLPVGGIGDYTNFTDPAVYELEDSFLNSDDEALEEIAKQTQERIRTREPTWVSSARSLFLAMFSTLILMIPVSWVYKSIHEGSIYDHSIDETALILPAVVAGIVTVVQHSLALAFSLAGIVAGVRFRRALSDTFDTLFIFVAIGVGIAAGIRSLEIAAVITVFFNYATIVTCTFGDGLESQYLARKKLLRQQKKAELLAQQEHSATKITSAVTPPDVGDF